MLAGVSDVSTVDLLGVSLRLLERNNRFLANNLANIDTPNFRPTHVDFNESLRLALRDRVLVPEKVQAQAAFSRELRVALEDDGLEARNDGNTVDIETEMMRLAENTSKYELYGTLLKKKFSITKNMLTRLK